MSVCLLYMAASGFLLTAPTGEEAMQEVSGMLPRITGAYGAIPERMEEYQVILRPDTIAPEWWAGAPSVVRDASGVFWMACRMRTADAPRGLRGYEIRLLRSADGVRFERVHSIRREDVPIPGFERPALLTDPKTGRFKLYGCGPVKEGVWSIIKFDDADSPEQFRPESARTVITPPPPANERDIVPLGYKDPFICFAEGRYHCYVIGYIRQNERIFHFVSDDGERWEPACSPCDSMMALDGWHDFFVRPACVVPLGVGYLFVYEGSNTKWHDPVYNIGTGLAFTFDLHRVIDLTPESPLLLSPTPGPRFATFRYSHWLWVDGELWIYAEVANTDETNEVRLFRLKP